MTLGATELRAHASGHGEELATLGLRLAVESGSAARVLAAAERRARPRPAAAPRPPAGRRGARRRARRAAPRHRRARRVAARRPPRRRARPPPDRARDARSAAAPCAPAAKPTARPTRVRPPLDALGERVLVEFFALDGRLHAVTVARRARARCTGSATRRRSRKEVASLRFSLRSLATARPGSRAADAMAGICATVAAAARPLLIAPLRLDAARRSCSSRPASCTRCRGRCCPSLAHRPLAVAPSLRLWQRAAPPTPASGRAGARRRPAAARRDRRDRDARARATRTRSRSPERRHRRRASRTRSTAPTPRTSPPTATSATTTRRSAASSSPTAP